MNTPQPKPEKEIMVLVLTSGLQLVGETTYNPILDSYKVFKPFKDHILAVPQPTPQGIQMGLSTTLVPAFPFTGSTTFEIMAKDLLFAPTLAPKPLESQWIQMTSGLQVGAAPGGSKIIM